MYWCLTPVDDIIMMLSLRETDLAVLRELMQRLYTHLTNDEDAITALGLSQAGNVSVRQSRPSLTPTAWAGFVVLGKP
ncbi:MAG: hypothetical protein ABSG69_10125 [Candidatus Acidiferrum sp.]